MTGGASKRGMCTGAFLGTYFDTGPAGSAAGLRPGFGEGIGSAAVFGRIRSSSIPSVDDGGVEDAVCAEELMVNKKTMTQSNGMYFIIIKATAAEYDFGVRFAAFLRAADEFYAF